jgi:predicted 3-demethylubiquinone-9 3-methyltransferase (glyoxalase superfamily)
MTGPYPFLWFDNQAEEAANFYVGVFKGTSRIKSVVRSGAAGTEPSPRVLTVTFSLNGAEFTALNGGPTFTFTEAISFSVECESQKELDYYWEALSAGGQAGQCGWLKDKYGLSWQVTPRVLGKLLGDPDPDKAKAVMEAMLAMYKIDIDGLFAAYDGPARNSGARAITHSTRSAP